MDEIASIRGKVDAIDNQILKDIAARVELCRAIGELKKKQGKPVHDSNRESEVFKRVKERALHYKIDPAVTERIYREIVNMCSNVQE